MQLYYPKQDNKHNIYILVNNYNLLVNINW